MSRNYMRVIVTNESHATLRLKHATTSGDWTPGGWTPATYIETPPGASLWWQAEGESISGVVPFTGVETRAWYDVVDAAGTVVGEFYVHANSPLIESQYGNTFHVRAPAGYYPAYVDADGQKRGNRAVLDIAFRDTARVAVPGFTPSVNGFAFPNTWSGDLPVVTLGWLWNRLRDAIQDDVTNELGIGWMPEDWIPLTHADSGLCGGMTFTAVDYFLAGQLPPVAAQDADGMFVAPDSESDPLFRHIRDRLLESFDVNGRGSRWLSYSSPVYPDDDEGVLQSVGFLKALSIAKGKSWVTYREEWPRIRRELDEGRLAPLGLVQSADFDIGANHQVLAYAYEQSGQVVRLWIYDPNVPGQSAAPAVADDLYLEFDITDTSHGITVTRHNAPAGDAAKHVYAILYMDAYTPHVPPTGTPIPPPDRPKLVSIAVSAESFTTGGVTETETENRCGEPMRTGMWTSRTTATFTAQASGFARPEVSWRVGGSEVAGGATSVDIVNDSDGVTYAVACRLDPGGRALSLSSQSGETYATRVEAFVEDVDGAMVSAAEDFDVSGTYSGLRIEDIRAAAQCEVRLIPVPVDVEPPTEPPGPDPKTINAEELREKVLEESLKVTGGPVDYTVIKEKIQDQIRDIPFGG